MIVGRHSKTREWGIWKGSFSRIRCIWVCWQKVYSKTNWATYKKAEEIKKLNLDVRNGIDENTPPPKKNIYRYSVYIDTFPLMLDVILYVEVDSDISSDTSRPALSDVGLGNFYYGKSRDHLGHPCPASKHQTTIFRLPMRRDKKN